MISIIICSRDASYLRKVSENVAATIGVPYELQVIDNSKGEYGICEAYNLGAARSRFNVLCFMHEDIAFVTQDWGRRVLDTLRDPSIGLIGVAGGQVKTRNPESWWVPGDRFLRINLIQSFQDVRPTFENCINPLNETISDVVSLDGVWFSCRREVWEQNRFDSHTFPEFHFYDLDFAMQVFQKGHRVCVVYDVLLEHFSSGSINASWVKNAIRFSRKWRKHLPVSTQTFDKYKWNRLENESCKYFITVMLSVNLKNATFFYYLFKYLFSHPQGWTLSKVAKETLRTVMPQIYRLLKPTGGNAG
ncbi:MAG: hypothetical protein AVDCRST_MAG56-4896 [uncultured Cytophagales bacterium]|uniref:Streptomycin biosynthesis protein StrF domain-containing protein n=1 Tax=uncultured Cytophagales bacterium TaxID=158755 RepID=A0A6J4JML4_9SPHI|nr:MAG: hypothetical protein AVDCRST_MAG56-4896 [uncultured Cytophagales bacterium]